MRLIFMGSPDFACPTLKALIQSEHSIEAIYCQPPKPAGRGQKLRNTPVHELAVQHDLTVRHPQRLKGAALTELLATPCDAIVVVAYGLLLPKAVLKHVPCLNIHPSALPRWRGAAPLQHTILNGDKTSEICIMQLDEGMDTGPVYLRHPLTIGENETVGELHDRTSADGAKLMLEVLANLAERTPVPQTEDSACLAPKITPDMRPIDWTQSAQNVHNHIRGMSPFPAATGTIHDTPLKFFESRVSTETGTAGDILHADKTGITIACGKGAVTISSLQRPSKKRVAAQDFLQGFPLKKGDTFATD